MITMRGVGFAGATRHARLSFLPPPPATYLLLSRCAFGFVSVDAALQRDALAALNFNTCRLIVLAFRQAVLQRSFLLVHLAQKAKQRIDLEKRRSKAG